MSKQNYALIDKWKIKNTDRIQILPRKSEYIPALIQIAIDKGIAKSRQAYILNAIRTALERDGITTDLIPK